MKLSDSEAPNRQGKGALLKIVRTTSLCIREESHWGGISQSVSAAGV